jgi:hypothetical protein
VVSTPTLPPPTPEIVPLLLGPTALTNGQYEAAKTTVGANDSVTRMTSRGRTVRSALVILAVSTIQRLRGES